VPARWPQQRGIGDVLALASGGLRVELRQIGGAGVGAVLVDPLRDVELIVNQGGAQCSQRVAGTLSAGFLEAIGLAGVNPIQDLDLGVGGAGLVVGQRGDNTEAS
jgi:hypothetical protein